MFLNKWKDIEQMKDDFWPDENEYSGKYSGELRNARILLASYGTPSYEGYAFVLFERGGKLYEINGSHCSCYGLEGQWNPEETTVEALRYRLENGELGMVNSEENPFAAELHQVLDAFIEESKNIK